MPIQINEVVIKIAVDNSPAAGGSGSSRPPQSSSDMAAQVAEQVLAILKEKTER